MNKEQLIDIVQQKVGNMVTKADIKRVLTAYEQTVIEVVSRGERVRQAGFGQFYSTTTPARVARNLQTGEHIHLSETKVPKFKAFSAFKDELNNN